MEQSIVKIQQLTHRYHAGYVLQDININIPRTGVMGLLGVNGAGKSTIMNILCGVLTPTSGKVYINGIDITVNPEAAKKDIGFLPQTAPLHMDLTIDEYLIHAARMRRMPSAEIPQALAAVKRKCHLAHYSKRLIGSLSGGYRQRVGIAQAIIHHPALVVFDEPTNGLDPVQILEVRNVIREIAEERTVLFSSHILSEVALLCRNVLMIDRGKLVFTGTMEQFSQQDAPHSLIARFEQPPAEALLRQIAGVKRVEWLSSVRVRLGIDQCDQIAQRIIDANSAGGWALQELYFEQASLNETFAQFLKHENNI